MFCCLSYLICVFVSRLGLLGLVKLQRSPEIEGSCHEYRASGPQASHSESCDLNIQRVELRSRTLDARSPENF